MVRKVINPLTELTHGMWVEGASHHHLTKAHQMSGHLRCVWPWRTLDPELGRTQKESTWGGLATIVFSACSGWGQPRAHALWLVPFWSHPLFSRARRPVTHPFTLCPRLLWHMPSPTILGAQSLEQAHQRSAQGPPVSDLVSTTILYHFPAREETEGQSELVTNKQKAAGTRSLSSWRPSPLLPRKHQYLHLGVDTCKPEVQMIPWVLQSSRGQWPVQGSPTILHAAAILSKVNLPQASRKKRAVSW